MQKHEMIGELQTQFKDKPLLYILVWMLCLR